MSGRDPRPLLLLPPSKGKADGGAGPRYGTTLDTDDPLDAPRRELLEAVSGDVSGLDDPTLARVAGVRRSEVDATRALLADLASARTLPAHQRYTGIVHGNAGFAALDPDDQKVDVRIVSALGGLVTLATPLPAYRLEFAASLPSLGGIATWWRARAHDHLAALVADRRVWDLLPGEHARLWDREVRDAADVVTVAFVRPDGRAANAARTKVCKGRLAAFLLAAPFATPGDLAREADPGPGWELQARARRVVATFCG